MAANLTSGNYQRYEEPGIRILQALKPDICCIQEFNYNGGVQDFVQVAFGAYYHYYREPYNSAGDVPNGIIYHQDFKLLASGSWKDSQIPNRGFAYVRLDIPGNNPHLFVMSVHLSTNDEKRRLEVQELLHNLFQYFGVQKAEDIQDYIVLAGDFNTGNRNAEALWILKTEGLFVDNPIPIDQSTVPDTNASRSLEHDYVLPHRLLSQYHATLTIGNQTFPNGLVFDSRVYSPLSNVPPVKKEDSAAVNMQHMAVIKLFLVPSN
jgi:hypothetical protein